MHKPMMYCFDQNILDIFMRQQTEWAVDDPFVVYLLQVSLSLSLSFFLYHVIPRLKEEKLFSLTV